MMTKTNRHPDIPCYRLKFIVLGKVHRIYSVLLLKWFSFSNLSSRTLCSILGLVGPCMTGSDARSK